MERKREREREKERGEVRSTGKQTKQISQSLNKKSMNKVKKGTQTDEHEHNSRKIKLFRYYDHKQWKILNERRVWG